MRTKKIIPAEVVTIGNELLTGKTLNTNARFLGRRLSEWGFHVKRQISCPDDIEEIKNLLNSALSRSDLVFLTGGLGPTPDDVTRDAVASFFKVPLKFSAAQYRRIRRYYRIRRRRVPACVKQEAMFPANARPLINCYGIALGFTVSCGQKCVVVLPGVPSELENMTQDPVRRFLKSHFPGLRPARSLVYKMIGTSEPEVMERLGKDFIRDDFEFGIYPHDGEICMRLQPDGVKTLRRLESLCERRLASFIFAREDISLAEVVGRILTERGLHLAVAESCTGGAVSESITAVPGSSRYFKGAVVAYANKIKEKTLGISPRVIARNGAVSRQVALALAESVRKKMDADYGLSVTGIAGPAGGSREKPVGTVFIACSSEDKKIAGMHWFAGDRDQVRRRTVRKAFEYLWRQLTGT